MASPDIDFDILNDVEFQEIEFEPMEFEDLGVEPMELWELPTATMPDK